jgi:hypothetical protein
VQIGFFRQAAKGAIPLGLGILEAAWPSLGLGWVAGRHLNGLARDAPATFTGMKI